MTKLDDFLILHHHIPGDESAMTWCEACRNEATTASHEANDQATIDEARETRKTRLRFGDYFMLHGHRPNNERAKERCKICLYERAEREGKLQTVIDQARRFIEMRSGFDRRKNQDRRDGVTPSEAK